MRQFTWQPWPLCELVAQVVVVVVVLFLRPDRGERVHRGAVRGLQRPGLRHLRHQGHQVPADPADAPRGQAGGNLEAPGIRRVHTQTGE